MRSFCRLSKGRREEDADFDGFAAGDAGFKAPFRERGALSYSQQLLLVLRHILWVILAEKAKS